MNLNKYIVLIIGCCFTMGLKAQNSTELPNILWIVSEDNSPLLGCYGDDFATTPHLDKLASEGILYENAFATVPVCAPARSSIITGMYPASIGTENMRSHYPVPDFVKFFPALLREAGYYTTNNAKKDYNTTDQKTAWNESSRKATYRKRGDGRPFFAVFNLNTTHESSLHKPKEALKHDPEEVSLPPYHPATAEMKYDWARYYDQIEKMDAQVGALLRELEDSGFADNTIVFYYSDHGGALGRSKRFIYESGLRVPLIVRFPEKYQHLAPAKPGSRSDRLVTFADFAPTVLSLANISVPEYIQGRAFLGKQRQDGYDFAFASRARMDERVDLVRSVRNKQYRYVRNYMPHKIYGQYLDYLWRAPSMRSWEAAYKAGELNDVQRRFWEPKPAEELYDIDADPHNVNNLAGDESYRGVLEKMRKANRQWMLKIKDAGFIPESMIVDITKNTSLYSYVRSGIYPLEQIIETAEIASSGDAAKIDQLIVRMKDPNPIVRYWAATGCIILKEDAASAGPVLLRLLNDPQACVSIAAAEALYALGDRDKAVVALEKALTTPNEMARLQALNVLATYNETSETIINSVRALINDSNQYDVRMARGIIQSLGK